MISLAKKLKLALWGLPDVTGTRLECDLIYEKASLFDVLDSITKFNGFRGEIGKPYTTIQVDLMQADAHDLLYSIGKLKCFSITIQPINESELVDGELIFKLSYTRLIFESHITI